MNLAYYLNSAKIETRAYNADATTSYLQEHTLSYSEKFYRLDQAGNFSSPAFDAVHKEFEELLKNETPKVVGISVKSDMVCSAIKMATMARDILSDVKIVFGGTHFSAKQDTTLTSMADAILIGEGETVIVEMIQELLKTKGRHPCRIWNSCNRSEYDVNDYVDIEFRYLVDFQQKAVSKLSKLMISSSRGCPYNCAFCFKSIKCNNRVRYVVGDKVAGFVKKAYHNYGIKKFYFVDDTFGISNKQLNDFGIALDDLTQVIRWSCMSHVNVLTKEKLELLKSLGCSAIHLGVESGSQRILNMLNKNVLIDDILRCSERIHSCGIELRAFVLFGIPGETSQDLQETKLLLHQIVPEEIAAQVYVPYDGTLLFNELKSKSFIADIDWAKFIKANLNYGIQKAQKNSNKDIKGFFDFVDNWNSIHNK